MTTARALLQMAEDSGAEDMVASARQEMDQCMALSAEPASAVLPFRDSGKAGLSNRSRAGDSQPRVTGVAAGGTSASLVDSDPQRAASTAGIAGGGSRAQLGRGDGAQAGGSDGVSGFGSQVGTSGAQQFQQVQGQAQGQGEQGLFRAVSDLGPGRTGGRQRGDQERAGEQNEGDLGDVQKTKRREALRRLEEAFRLLMPTSGPITVSSTMGSAAAVLAAASGTVSLSVGGALGCPGVGPLPALGGRLCARHGGHCKVRVLGAWSWWCRPAADAAGAWSTAAEC